MKNKYEIHGDVTVLYLNVRNKESVKCIIDTKHLEKLIKFGITWCLSVKKASGLRYVRGNFRTVSGQKKIALHRYLMGEPDGDIDHINRNSLDNRVCNLRIATKVENAQNKSLRKTNTSGAIGVMWHKQKQKWYARFKYDNKTVFQKLYDDFDQAVIEIEEVRNTYNKY